MFSFSLGLIAYADTCPTGFKRPSYKTRSFYCSPGEFVKDYYNGDKRIACIDMEVDHLIPLKVAHCAGLSEDALKRLANDPDNLRFTTMNTNRSKGAKNLHDFAITLTPENREKVLRDGIKIKEKYLIPVSKIEKRELAHLSQLSLIQQMTRKKILLISKRINKRIVNSTARNIALSKPQSATIVLAPFALAIVAWELYDACRMLEDISELEGFAQNSLTNVDRSGEDFDNNTWSSSSERYDNQYCGLSRSELVATITGKDPKFDACVAARLNNYRIDPPECDDYEFSTPSFESEEKKESSDFSTPTFD